MMDDDLGKKASRFKANRGEDFHLWALRFEALAEYKEVSTVIFENDIGDLKPEDLTTDVKAKL